MYATNATSTTPQAQLDSTRSGQPEAEPATFSVEDSGAALGMIAFGIALLAFAAIHCFKKLCLSFASCINE
jgi:hypothetical protein